MFSSRKLNKIVKRIYGMDIDHLNSDDYSRLSKDWGVSIQDLMVANNIAIQRRELSEVEKLDGGSGVHSKKTSTQSIIELFTGERKS